MRIVRDWWIQTTWWASGIFASGAVWYFLSVGRIALTVFAGTGATALAAIAIYFHRTKDAQDRAAELNQETHRPRGSAVQDKVVSSEWWNSSPLRDQYEGRGLYNFRWSNSDRVADCEREGYEVVCDSSSNLNSVYRIVNRSGQILLARAKIRPNE